MVPQTLSLGGSGVCVSVCVCVGGVYTGVYRFTALSEYRQDSGYTLNQLKCRSIVPQSFSLVWWWWWCVCGGGGGGYGYESKGSLH